MYRSANVGTETTRFKGSWTQCGPSPGQSGQVWQHVFVAPRSRGAPGALWVGIESNLAQSVRNVDPIRPGSVEFGRIRPNDDEFRLEVGRVWPEFDQTWPKPDRLWRNNATWCSTQAVKSGGRLWRSTPTVNSAETRFCDGILVMGRNKWSPCSDAEEDWPCRHNATRGSSMLRSRSLWGHGGRNQGEGTTTRRCGGQL